MDKNFTVDFFRLTMLISALVTYWGNFQYFYELTFLSSFLSGVLFIVAAVISLREIELHPIIYLCDCILLLIVFGVCIAFANKFRFDGGFAFLHIINPILSTVYFMLFADTNKTRSINTLFVAGFPLIYLVFVIIFGSITDNFIYFFMDYKSMGIGYTLMFIAALFILIIAFGFAFFYSNKLIHRCFLKSKSTVE